jgi:hypothetical protein
VAGTADGQLPVIVVVHDSAFRGGDALREFPRFVQPSQTIRGKSLLRPYPMKSCHFHESVFKGVLAVKYRRDPVNGFRAAPIHPLSNLKTENVKKEIGTAWTAYCLGAAK